MSVHLYARDEKGLRSRWYARFVPLGAYAGKDGAFFYPTVVGQKWLLPLRKRKWARLAVNGQSAAYEDGAKKVV